jgi:hypothetical protein
MIRILICCIVLSLGAPTGYAGGGSGSVPLRGGGGGGSIPVRLSGEAIPLAQNGNKTTTSLDGIVSESNVLNTNVCKPGAADISAFKASGSIAVGVEQYVLSALCVSAAGGQLEFIATKTDGTDEQVRIVGPTPADGFLASFRGRMVITSDTLAAERYLVRTPK